MKKKEDKNISPMATAWKPPTKRKMMHDAIHDEVRNSRRKWVSGEISTKDHKETMRRAATALGMPVSVKVRQDDKSSL